MICIFLGSYVRTSLIWGPPTKLPIDIRFVKKKLKKSWDPSTDPQPGQIQDGRHFKGKSRKLS